MEPVMQKRDEIVGNNWPWIYFYFLANKIKLANLIQGNMGAFDNHKPEII